MQPSMDGAFSDYFSTWMRRAGLRRTEGVVAPPTKDAALIIVDMQNDFVKEWEYSDEDESPCREMLHGSYACFGVKEGRNAARAIGDLLGAHTFQSVVVSGDWHDENHCSFVYFGGTTKEIPVCQDNILPTCTLEDQSQCVGTNWLRYTGGQGWGSGGGGIATGRGHMNGPFPPHCQRNNVGAEIYQPVNQALEQYISMHDCATCPDAPVYGVVKGLNVGTDSFGVFPYSTASRAFWDDLGLLSMHADVGGDALPVAPAALIRSMLTWEKDMNTGTGARNFDDGAFAGGVLAPPAVTFHRFSPGDDFSAGWEPNQELLWDQSHQTVELIGRPGTVFVTGLALDWCVLDTALNYKALNPKAAVYIVLDAARPSFLPRTVSLQDGYISDEDAQCVTATPGISDEDGCFLLNPEYVGQLIRAAEISIIFSDQFNGAN